MREMIDIFICNISDDVTILGHVFHGLDDIKKHVEMSLYKNWSRGEARVQKSEKTCDVHVGEMWMPYPCFDWEDSINENRTYQNYVIRQRPITQEDMRRLSELPSHSNEQRIWDDVPEDMLPLVFYCGDGQKMLVAQKQDTKVRNVPLSK